MDLTWETKTTKTCNPAIRDMRLFIRTNCAIVRLYNTGLNCLNVRSECRKALRVGKFNKIPIIMEKKSLVKFENVELELFTSESELSEVRGGKGIADAILDILTGGGSIEINIGCNECKD